MLRIGFDAKRAFLNNTGLGSYSRMLIDALVNKFPENNYFLYSPKIRWNSQTAQFKAKDNINIRSPKFPILKSLWRSKFIISDLKKDKINLYHGLSHELPYGIQKSDMATIVTIHDLIFFRYPEFYKLADRKIYEAKFRFACLHADKIIAVSHQTKRDLQTFLQVPVNRIEVIYQSCSTNFHKQFAQKEIRFVQKKYNLPNRFLLNVGTIEERKNLLLIAKALRQVPNEIKLVVIGKPTPYAEKVKIYLKENQLTKRVLFIENIPLEELPIIYRLAEIFIYPSRFEGFGIPILEAISSGIPVIAATGSCLEESGGAESIYIDPDHEESLSEAIFRLWNNPDLRQQMITSGKEYALQFSPDQISKKMMNLYLKALQTKQ